MTEKLNNLEIKFKTWMENIPKPKGGNYTEKTINGYIYAIKNVCKDIKTLEVKYRMSLFNINSIDMFNIIEKKIRKNEDFDRLNKHYGTRTLNAALNKYSEFLKSRKDKDKLNKNVNSTKSYVEGSVIQVNFNKYERSTKARKACLDHYGSSCCVCNFNSKKIYKNIERNIIHVHHLKPLSEIGSNYEIDPIEDLRPVCPNCHAVIHSKKPAYKIEELKVLLKDRIKF